MLKFRKLKVEDANCLLEIYSDSKAMRYRGSKAMTSITDAINFIENQRKIEEGTLTVRKGVELCEENLLIGSSMIRIRNKNIDEYEIGYSIGSKYWGQGFGSEIVNMLVDYIYQKNSNASIIAWSNINNIASIRILEKNGFSKDHEDFLNNTFLFRYRIIETIGNNR